MKDSQYLCLFNARIMYTNRLTMKSFSKNKRFNQVYYMYNLNRR